jgi:hypothetical protein
MSVAEIGLLHSRYIRLSDRFKALWTYHQFATGVYKSVIGAPLPYQLDFQLVYERLKAVTRMLNSAQVAEAAAVLSANESLLENTSAKLLEADVAITASVLRRFFDKLKKQDDNIILHLVKFYLYSGAVTGDHRDKIDFLLTRLGEAYAAGSEYQSRESLEFRERLTALHGIHDSHAIEQAEVVRVVRAIRTIREEIQEADAFEELTERNLLRNARLFKHRLGDVYFHPEVLLAIIELNIATKNRFLKLYHSEEQRILDDSQKLMEYGQALARNFGEANPELVEEIARFQEYKERFDESRANSNVKHDVFTHLKVSMDNILSQLDRGLEGDDEVEEIPEAFFIQEQQAEELSSRFGPDPLLEPFLLRISSAIEAVDRSLPPEKIVNLGETRDLRLEPWEAAAYLKLYDREQPEAEEDGEELWLMYVRAAALRIKIDEEATILSTTMTAAVPPDASLLSKAKASLDRAKELDQLFADLFGEAAYYSNPRILRQLYRSRFRLLRGFSGLWLIYDRQT